MIEITLHPSTTPLPRLRLETSLQEARRLLAELDRGDVGPVAREARDGLREALGAYAGRKVAK